MATWLRGLRKRLKAPRVAPPRRPRQLLVEHLEQRCLMSASPFAEYAIPSGYRGQATGSSDPIGIASGTDGNIYFTEEAGDHIGRIITSASPLIPYATYTPAGPVNPPALPANPAAGTLTEFGAGWQDPASGTPADVTGYGVPGPPFTPVGLTAANNGNLNVWDFATPNINVNNSPVASSLNPSGQGLLFAEFYADRVGLMTPPGAFADFGDNQELLQNRVAQQVQSDPTGAANSIVAPYGTFWVASGADGNILFTEAAPSNTAASGGQAHGNEIGFMFTAPAYYNTNTTAIDAEATTAPVNRFSIPGAPAGNVRPTVIIADPDPGQTKAWFVENEGQRIESLDYTAYLNGGAPVFKDYNTPTKNSYPMDIVADPSGKYLWFTESNVDVTLNSSGTDDLGLKYQPATYKSQDGKTTHTGGAIGKLNIANGQITEYWNGMSNDAQPMGLTFGKDGNIYFTEFGTNKIGMLNPRTLSSLNNTPMIKESPAIPTANSGPMFITAGADGSLWFTEYNGNKVASIAPKSVQPAHSPQAGSQVTPSTPVVAPPKWTSPQTTGTTSTHDAIFLHQWRSTTGVSSLQSTVAAWNHQAVDSFFQRLG